MAFDPEPEEYEYEPDPEDEDDEDEDEAVSVLGSVPAIVMGGTPTGPGGATVAKQTVWLINREKGSKWEIYGIASTEAIAREVATTDKALGIADDFAEPIEMEIWTDVPPIITVAIREATWRGVDDAPSTTSDREYHYRSYKGDPLEISDRPTRVGEPRYLKVTGTDPAKVKEIFEERCGAIIAERMGLS